MKTIPIKVDVNEHVRKGTPKCADDCMFARAISDALCVQASVSVFPGFGVVMFGPMSNRVRVDLPETIRNAAKAYDGISCDFLEAGAADHLAGTYQLVMSDEEFAALEQHGFKFKETPA